MLKKAGIIAAVATAGVLAVSSVAFADTSKDNVGNKCAFGNASGDASQTITGDSSLLGALTSTFTGLVTNAATQANTGNCTNVQLKDLIDNDSNNKTRTHTKSEVDHSFNR